ncbi:hypothetical protein LSUE1_G008754, partial [Lachnellula suecica]
MKLLHPLSIAAAGLAPLAASLASYTPSISNGPSYKVGISSSSTISSSSAGGIYFSLTAPTSYQWVGLGIGKQMAGATIFVMYADGNGNVTISGRDGGQGHVEPGLDSSLMQGVTLLEGSGVVGGNMVANVHCTTCVLSSAANSQSAPWIAAWMEGSALNSNDAGTEIQQHGPSDYRQFTFDLTQAALTADQNPFVAAATSGSSPSSSTTSGPAAASSSSAAGSSSDTDAGSSSSSQEIGTSGDTINAYSKAHGIIMGLVVVILFPLASLFMRVVRHPWIHAGMQLFNLAAMIAGLGLGVKLAQFTDQLWNNTHTRFGVAIVALFLLQPFLGLAHHFTWQKTKSRNSFSHLHIWYGRILIILAVINGGLGLQLAANTRNGEIVYGVLAGVMAVVYVVVVVVKRKGP